MPLFAAMVAKYRTTEEADGGGGGGGVVILAAATQRRRRRATDIGGGLTRTTRGVGYGDGVYLRDFKKKNVGHEFTRLLEKGNTIL